MSTEMMYEYVHFAHLSVENRSHALLKIFSAAGGTVTVPAVVIKGIPNPYIYGIIRDIPEFEHQ